MIAYCKSPKQRIRDRYRPGTGYVKRARRRLWLLAVASGVCLTLLPTSQAKALTIDLETLLKGVSQVLTDVGGSPAVTGSREAEEREAAGVLRPEQPPTPPETHPTPAVEQEGTLPPPPAPAPRPQTAPPPQPTAAQVPPVLHRIAECESGGDWTAENPRSTASGKWQFLDSTWRSQEASGDYRRAKHAPPHIQRAAAIELYEAAGTRPWNSSKGCWA